MNGSLSDGRYPVGRTTIRLAPASPDFAAPEAPSWLSALSAPERPPVDIDAATLASVRAFAAAALPDFPLVLPFIVPESFFADAPLLPGVTIIPLPCADPEASAATSAPARIERPAEACAPVRAL